MVFENALRAKAFDAMPFNQILSIAIIRIATDGSFLSNSNGLKWFVS